MLNGFMASGKAPNWTDMVRPKPQDKRAPDEVAADVITRAGITLT